MPSTTLPFATTPTHSTTTASAPSGSLSGARAKHSIVIVGGGTAGWMTALLMAQQWREQVQISLIESPDIGIIGVGEGSTPSLKRFFSQLGIADSEWMARCNATYKVSIRFRDWSPGTGIASYSHPFISQLDQFSELAFYQNCFARRQGLDVTTLPDKFLFNGYLADAGLSPVTPPHFPFRIEYGYHFDSALLGQFLKERAIALGVVHLPTTMQQVNLHPDGRIASVVCQDALDVHGELFVDCTGFRAELLQKTLGVKFDAFKANLFNDAAVVLPTPALSTLPPETRATALSTGWAWQIPLQHRTGNGYVYSRDFLSADAAETELRTHLGLLDSDIQARHLQMNVGQVRQHWAKNCVGIGLSQGFIEPLEATALHLVQTAVENFIDDYQQGGFTDRYAARYNHSVSQRFDATRDYIVAHYKFNSRDDTDYWRANRANEQLSDRLQQIMHSWFALGDLGKLLASQQRESMFGNTSWHCLLAGYGVFPHLASSQPSAAQLAARDQWHAQGLDALFQGCCLNFQPQRP